MLENMDIISEIRSAGSYESAEALLAERTPDLILLDIHLGNKSGIDLLRFIHEQFPNVRVIMLSNQSSSRHRAICQELGAVHFLDKSTEFGQVRAVITSFLKS